jgi:hypothetical protein
VPAGEVQVTGGGKLSKLVGADGRTYRTGVVPGGPYAVTVEIQGQLYDLGTVNVPPNGKVLFDCNELTFDCERKE